LAAAANLARVAGLLRRSFFALAGSGATLLPLILAHRARCAAAIFALTAADLRPFLGASSAARDGTSPPPETIEAIWPRSVSICSLMEIML